MQNVSMAAWNLAAGSGGSVRSSEKTGVAEDSFQSYLGKTDSAAGDISAGTATFLVDGLQLIVAVLLMILGIMVAFSCLKKLFTTKKQTENA